MPVMTKKIKISSGEGTEITNITEQVQELVNSSGLKEGIANVFVIGSTASVSTIEFEPNLVNDMKAALERLVPSDIKYAHTKTWAMIMEKPCDRDIDGS